MTSQTDLDQGGSSRQFIRQYLGPSVGWITTPAPSAAILPITVAGSYSIQVSTTLVTVNVNGAVTLTLPKAVPPSVGPQAIPGLFAQTPITIVDIGGFAFANPITILPTSPETIMSLSSIQIASNYGGFTLIPNTALVGWVNQ